MDSSPSPTTSATPSTSSPAVDVSAHRSCLCCAKQMSSIKYDKHTFCLQCRNVPCSVEVRCSECSDWSLDVMQDYLRHRKSLVSKGRNKAATAVSTASASSTPEVSTVSSVVNQPALPSVSDDEKIKDYVRSFLSQFLTQSGILGTNPSVSAPSVVPPHSSPPSRGATGGGGATSLNIEVGLPKPLVRCHR